MLLDNKNNPRSNQKFSSVYRLIQLKDSGLISLCCWCRVQAWVIGEWKKKKRNWPGEEFKENKVRKLKREVERKKNQGRKGTWRIKDGQNKKKKKKEKIEVRKRSKGNWYNFEGTQRKWS